MGKCTFMMSELVYLGFDISKDGIKMGLEKIEAIVCCHSPKHIFKVMGFHGLARFYQKFIKNFSGICAPIVERIKEDRQPFCWTTAAEESF